MRTPTLFKPLLCCSLIVAALALPSSAWTAVAEITDSGTEAAAPASESIAAPAVDNGLPALAAPMPFSEPDHLAPMPMVLANEPVSVPAPEPSGLLLLAIGIGLLWLIRRKR